MTGRQDSGIGSQGLRKRNVPPPASLEEQEKPRGQVSTFNTKEEPKGFKIWYIEVRSMGKAFALKEKAGKILGGEGIRGERDKGMK